MWQHNVYYVCVTFSVVRYVGLIYYYTESVLVCCVTFKN